MPDPADYRLYRSQTAVMAAIRQAVTAGYRYYLVATTPEEKVLVAVEKISKRHYALISPEAQRVRREAGLPTARLFLGPEPRGGPLALRPAGHQAPGGGGAGLGGGEAPAAMGGVEDGELAAHLRAKAAS